MRPDDTIETDWRPSVTVSEDPALEPELAARLPAHGSRRSIAVTELVAPRQAYWRAIAPVPRTVEREERLDLGRTVHRLLGGALKDEGRLEVRVRREGTVGRIDLLADVPVEVKTSTTPVAAEELVTARPDQVEQLAMYVALAGGSIGRLVTLEVDGGEIRGVRALDVRFGEIDSVRREMLERANDLWGAWADRSPGALARCRWFDRGCEFHDAGVCGCTGSEPPPSGVVAEEVAAVAPRPDVAERIAARIRDAARPAGPPRVGRIRELVYPRRAYFERTAPLAPAPPRARDPLAPADLYERVRAAIESGPVGDVVRLPPLAQELEEEVAGFRGAPYLVRTSRAKDRASPASLMEAQPQYAFELGLRCVATGTRMGRLVLARERATDPRDQLQVFEMRFGAPTIFSKLWRERAGDLEAAVRARDPGALPACPAWMYATCPYAAECGCDAAAARSHR